MSDKSRTFRQYRQTDIIIWAVILCVFETIVSVAGSKWFTSQPYSVSIVPSVVSIVMMRWGSFGLVHAFLGGIMTVLPAGGGLSSFIVYAVGNLLCVLSLFFLKCGREKVRESWFLSGAFALTTALEMFVGRAVVSLIFEKNISKSVTFVTTDLLSAVFAVIIVLTVRNLDGVFEDQKHYLIRINKEDEEGGLA